MILPLLKIGTITLLTGFQDNTNYQSEHCFTDDFFRPEKKYSTFTTDSRMSGSSRPCDSAGAERPETYEKRTDTTRALAIVPYDENQIMPHHKIQRDFQFVGHNVVIEQNWRGLGVAGVVWDAAIVLCEYLEKNPHTVMGKRIIELGAGTGLVGIVAAYLGGKVTVTERTEAILHLKKTVSVNLADAKNTNISVRELDWTKDLDKYNFPFDVILGADVIYIEDTFKDLLQALVHLSNEETLVVLSCRIRYERDEKFLKLLREKFGVDEIFYSQGKDIKIIIAKKLPKLTDQ